MLIPIAVEGGSVLGSLVELLKSLGKPLFDLGGAPVSLASILTCIAFVIVAFIISKFLRRLLTRVYQKRHMDVGMQHSLNRLLHYIVVAVGIYLAVDNLGVSLSALAAVAGVLLVGIGFGLQELAKNFISGLILLLERPIRKGDYIEIGQEKTHVQGTVIEIGLRATTINTYDDIEIIIPNGKLINEVVVNRLYQHSYYRIRINVGVDYNSDPEQVRDLLIGVAEAHPDILDTPKPIVFFEHFADSYLDFRLMGWLDDAKLEPRVKSDLHYGVIKAFREAGVNMPFPQMDVHVKETLSRTDKRI